jgi:hypothetical protein
VEKKKMATALSHTGLHFTTKEMNFSPLVSTVQPSPVVGTCDLMERTKEKIDTC